MTSRISTPAVEAATGATAALFADIKKMAGGVPNVFATIGSLNPSALKSVLEADAVLERGTLGKQDLETIKLIISEEVGCDYCVAAHNMLGKMAGLKPEVLKQIRAGQPTGDAKRDALVRLVRTLQRTSGTISAGDFSAIKAAGYTDAQLVEITLAITTVVFTNVFNRINDTTVDFPAV